MLSTWKLRTSCRLASFLMLSTSNFEEVSQNCSPHLCVGFLFLILYPEFFPASPPPTASRRLLFTHIFHTPSLPTIIFHKPSFTHHLSHTNSHTHTHTPLSTTIFHTPSFNHRLSLTIFHTHLCQPPSFTSHLSHTIFYTHNLLHTIFCFPRGLALGDVYLRFAWQAWHLWHWVGSGGALGLGLVAGDAAPLCVAGVALGDI